MTAFIITARQIRAARGLVGWSQSDLGFAADISRSTIAAIENGTANPTLDMLSRIRAVLETQQIEFLTQEGVRFCSPTIQYDDAPLANRRLLDDIYNAALEHRHHTNNDDILIYGLREEDAEASVGDYLTDHFKRLALAKLKEKILCTANTKKLIAKITAPVGTYKRLPEPLQHKNIQPLHVYGNKVAIVQWKPKETVVIVDSKPLADACRSMFDYIWNLLPELKPHDH
jgi:transcriptional regulator with XRE-family HTH domain